MPSSLTGPSVPAPVGELAGDRFGHGTPAVEVGPGLDELLAQDIDELLQVYGGSCVLSPFDGSRTDGRNG